MDTVTITGGWMELISASPNADFILGGPAWSFTLDPFNSTCIELLPGWGGVLPGPIEPNICHVGAIASVRPIGAPCPGCFDISYRSEGSLLYSEKVLFGDLPELRITPLSSSAPEPGTLALLLLAAGVIAIRHWRKNPSRRGKDIECLC